MVWVIRRYRPDVIMLGFSGTPRDGHGQHQTSAILGKEAFTAAADPKMFPEQLKYVQLWQAKRLVQAAGLRRLRPGGRADAVVAADAAPRAGRIVPPCRKRRHGREADTGAFNPILGYSYEELAVLSRSMHHSQGTGAMRRPGAGRATFTVIGGRARDQGSLRRHRHHLESPARRRGGQGRFSTRRSAASSRRIPRR